MEKLQKIVVAGVIANKGKFLVVKRSASEKILPNKWELPSGKVEFEEDPNNALIREIEEEINITPEKFIPIKITDYTLGNKHKKKHTVQIIFLIKSSDNKIKLSSEHDEYRWIDIEELNNLNTFDDMQEILLCAQKNLNNL
jgi:mutator protein MutT